MGKGENQKVDKFFTVHILIDTFTKDMPPFIIISIMLIVISIALINVASHIEITKKENAIFILQEMFLTL